MKICALEELKEVMVCFPNSYINRNRKNENGEREADFINCVMWRQQAENLDNWTKKGHLIGIT